MVHDQPDRCFLSSGDGVLRRGTLHLVRGSKIGLEREEIIRPGCPLWHFDVSDFAKHGTHCCACVVAHVGHAAPCDLAGRVLDPFAQELSRGCPRSCLSGIHLVKHHLQFRQPRSATEQTPGRFLQHLICERG
eukprot:5709283-Prymnesium_polylepis.1